MFDGKKLMDGTPADQTLLWIRQTQDCSSAATGSTLFDFDGDGRVEAVYADEVNLHVYDSATGAERFTTCNTSGTLIEYPLVADVDNDGQADLIVVSNAYAFDCVGQPGVRHSGVRVFSQHGRRLGGDAAGVEPARVLGDEHRGGRHASPSRPRATG